MSYRNWLGTKNNPEIPAQEFLEGLHVSTRATYTCGQLERGSSGTTHVQFFMNFATKARMSQITKVDSKLHLEPVLVNNGAHTYCMKEDTRVEGPWEFGVRPLQRNNKTDWDSVKALAKANHLDEIPAQIYVSHYSKLKAIAKDHMVLPPPTPHTKGVWITGPSGCGKSRLARERYPEAYPKLCNKWWDGYKGQKAVIMDDIGPEHECLGQQLKVWADHYSCILEAKGCALASEYDWFVVTSQYTIDEIFKDQKTRDALHRRFKVIRWAFPGSLPTPPVHDEEIILGKRPLTN